MEAKGGAFTVQRQAQTIMESRQLLYFTRIVELGSFTKAAAELRIAQPSLGQQVRKLEEELGTALLVRHSRGVLPTEAGAVLFQHASRILDDVRAAKEAVLSLSNRPAGNVTVGMTPGIGDLFAAKLVEICNRDCPAIRLNIEQDLSVRLVRRISSDDALSFALVSGMECDAVHTLIEMPLAIEQLYLVGSPRLSNDLRDPVRFSRLASLRLIMLGIGDRRRARGLKHELEAEATRRGMSLNFSHEMQSVTAVQDLIERDIGFGILPFGAVRRRIEEGSLKAFRIVEPGVYREIRLVRSPRRQLSAADRAVLERLLHLATEETRKRQGSLGPIVRSNRDRSADVKSRTGVLEISEHGSRLGSRSGSRAGAIGV
jgi:LysR family transcriptional regulator, nitrogen assimilation regulatory protein